MTGFFAEAPWLTLDRLLVWGKAFALLSLALLAWDVVSHTTNGVMNAAGEHLGRDFIDFWSGAKMALDGHAASVYSQPALDGFQKSLVGAASEFKVYSYPPFLMLLCAPLAPLPFVPGLALWWGLGWLVCAWLLSRLIGWRMAALAIIAAPACYLNFLSGQNGCLTAGLFVGGLMLLDRRPLLAGICFGFLAYKPQLGILLPIAFVAGGYWRTAMAAGATIATLVVVSAALLGTEAWIAFIHQMAFQRELMEFGGGHTACRPYSRQPGCSEEISLWPTAYKRFRRY